MPRLDDPRMSQKERDCAIAIRSAAMHLQDCLYYYDNMLDLPPETKDVLLATYRQLFRAVAHYYDPELQMTYDPFAKGARK
jgi:hypothetical protein